MRVLIALALLGIALGLPQRDLSKQFGEVLQQVRGVGPVIFPQASYDKPEKPLFGADDTDKYAGAFAEFVDKHNKNYKDSEELMFRYSVFKENMAKAELMREAERGTAEYGATQFADFTEEEFSRYTMPKEFFAQPHNLEYDSIPVGSVPDSFDWRTKGAVTEVKNQGSCGSCWAFSTTGNIEGQWQIKKGQLVSLSEQELVSCDKVDQGCEGGLPSQAYAQIMKLGGLETEKQYPYDGIDEKCNLKGSAAVYINSSVAISKDEKEMAAWLAANGPISIGINANMMQLYIGGIAHPWKIFCNPSHLDHGVLIVGYGTENGTPFWIVKNSWGKTWGEQGYYRVYRGDGTCGLNQMCTSAKIN